jgi:hypothetical protein
MHAATGIRSLVAVFLGVAVLGLLALLYLFFTDQPDEIIKDVQPKRSTPLPDTIAQELERLEEVAKTNSQEAERQADTLIERLPENFQRYLKFGLGCVEDFTFYGIVIDQHGEPVEGALVYNEEGGRYLASGSGFATMKTDAEGRFSISATGANMKIGPIRHPQLAEYRHLDNNGEIKRSAVFWDFQHVEGGNELLWGDYADKDNPFVFKVWRKDKNSANEKIKRNRSSSLFKLSCDGVFYTFDFSKKTIDIKQRDNVPNGQVRMRFICDEQYPLRQSEDWLFELEAVSGGVQETQDVYLNEAPQTGYQSRYQLNMEKDSSQYKWRLKKRFYFTSNNDQQFGSLEIDIDPYSGRLPRLFVSYKVNFSGSRVLSAF